MWGSTAVSSLDFILRPQVKGASGRIDFLPEKNDSIFDLLDRAKDPYIRNPSGAIEADHYTPTFLVLNLRDPGVREYWHKCWKEAQQRMGLGGIFLDSSFNLSSDKFHFIYNFPGERQGATADQTHLLGQSRPAQTPPKLILSMYFAHLELVAEMQRYGYHYSGEDIGVFGLHRSGPGIEQRLDNLFLWGECYVNFDRRAILDGGRDPDDIFFQGLAYRMMWFLYWNFTRQAVSFHANAGSPENDPTPWHLNLLRAFNEVERQMLNRAVLEGEKGVVYECEGIKVLWAFASFDFELSPPTTARDVLTNAVYEEAWLHAEKHHIYRITTKSSGQGVLD
jgi:hypothetical protein